MTAPHQDALRRLSDEFLRLSQHLTVVAGRLDEVQHVLSRFESSSSATLPTPPAPIPAPIPGPYPYATAAPAPLPYPAAHPARPPLPPAPHVAPPYRRDRDPQQGWIGKLLAVVGVTVTLIGVVLLLVLAAQAGFLRPEFRVSAGAVLALGLTAAGIRMYRTPGGRVGAIALTATGVAAAYMDVIALTAVYGWLPPAIGLLLAAVIGAAGLTLARRWNTEQLALLVLVPLAVLAPVVTDGVSLLLIAFMTALSAASLPVQLGRDWTWMYVARSAAVTLPLLAGLVIASMSSTHRESLLIGGACGVAALLAIAGALLLLPTSSRRTSMALAAVVGVLPALASGMAVPRPLATLLAAAVAIGVLAAVLLRHVLPGVDAVVATIWSALSAVAGLIAVTTAFEGLVEGPVLLGLAVLTASAGGHSRSARWAGLGFAVVGAVLQLSFAGPETLAAATNLSGSVAVSILVSSTLTIAYAVVFAWTTTSRGQGHGVRAGAIWAGAGLVALYSTTMVTVTAGVLVGGAEGGFLAGHMAATIIWVGGAAALFALARRITDRDARTVPLIGGLALTGAATAKLFLFDLATLDGMFRVVAFLVAGLILLGMGAGYARSLTRVQSAPQTVASKAMPHQP